MPFIDNITCIIYGMSSTVYDTTLTACVTSHNACISDITHSMFMIYPLYRGSHTVLWQHSHCVTSHPLCLTSHPQYRHHIHYVYDIICTTSYTSYTSYTSHPQFRTSYHFICDQVHTVWPHFLCTAVITTTVSVISQPLYVWPHIQYICNIISTIFVT